LPPLFILVIMEDTLRVYQVCDIIPSNES